MSVVVTSVIAAVSALVALATFALYLYFGRRADLAGAREEALALAETRRQVIGDLQVELEALEEQRQRDRVRFERRCRELQSALDKTRAQARNDAYQTQRFYAAALTDLLNELRGDLGQRPPDVEAALARIRKLARAADPAA